MTKATTLWPIGLMAITAVAGACATDGGDTRSQAPTTADLAAPPATFAPAADASGPPTPAAPHMREDSTVFVEPVPAEALVGPWALTREGAAVCRLTFQPSGAASPDPACPEPFANAASWSAAPSPRAPATLVELTAPNGAPLWRGVAGEGVVRGAGPGANAWSLRRAAGLAD